MKIGVSTLALSPTPLETVLTGLEDRKVEYCEIMNEYPYNDIDSDVVGSYNLKISIHSPLSDVNIASYNDRMRTSSVSAIKNSIDTAVSVGSDVVVVHPGQVPILGKKFIDRIKEHSLESLRECSNYADENGIMICIENMPDFEELLLRDLNEVHNVAEELDSHITLDVGHAYNMNFSVEEMLSSPRIKHIHLSDNDGSYDSHDAIGSTNIDFKSLFKELKSVNYDGILVVEVKDPAALTESLDYIKNELKI
ncbi:Xylose isomerase domain-containing protein TIM barrel [Methanobacterium lacus]|uniref:Xylose isomerase domain-containing protein TIM barrel n=1 Tax=Methanobacterium lacus (strain AL-21) TaxID=877455 RepID=F0TAB8_METLA|nr:sugar phosphate isomerase/epimerase family protein [Methanobacterium lacus]ADZ08870.1 Xylose isomerase domain-containing protein TIM barrel [Methanobacterium lacus]